KNKVVFTPHGTPDLPFNATEKAKKKKGLAGRYVLGNINLISESKGIEYTLEAVAEIAKKIPNVLALIVGQTHPGVIAQDGEKYRNSLKALIKKLKIKNNVKFVNKYVTLEELLDWLKAMDVYVTPYLDPQQSSSGALAYAIGAGKLCISTPYLYAKEVLKNGRGILVPFRNSKSIAEAVISTWEDSEKKKKIAKKAYDYGRLMTWSSVGLKHLDLFEAILRPNKDC
ncbi:MAG: glycosyltransferase, partial [Candidatus Moranbacteria bacterium]|nr:glycosyltransferase [Candidatus Moranbacteria bacterium]